MCTLSPAPADRATDLSVTVLVGNPKPGSRTAELASAFAQALTNNATAALVDLGNPDLDTDEARNAVLFSDPVVVASPTYKATYTGLLKSFLDALPSSAFDGTVVVPLITVGHPSHTLAADLHRRPLLLELGAIAPTPSVVINVDETLGVPAAITEPARRCRDAIVTTARVTTRIGADT